MNNEQKASLEINYKKAFDSNTFKMTETLYDEFEKVDNKSMVVLFLCSFLTAFATVYWVDFFNHIIGSATIVVAYLCLGISLYAMSHLILSKFAFKSTLVKYLNPALFAKYKEKQEDIEGFFLNKDNIKNLIDCMDYYKAQFGSSFTVIASRISVMNLELTLLTAYDTKKIEKIIPVYLEIKKEIDIINNNINNSMTNNIKQEFFR